MLYNYGNKLMAIKETDGLSFLYYKYDVILMK
jgi:hypothetical protein